MVERRGETPPAPSSGEPVATKLRRIARKARSEPELQFTSLFHLLNVELLRGCFGRLRTDAAAGIDRVTKAMYGEKLEANLAALAERLQRLAYIPQPVRRRYIPKPGSAKLRPPTRNRGDTDAGGQARASRAGAHPGGDLRARFRRRILWISPQPGKMGRGCHDALRTLSRTVERGRTNYLVEADIKGFFDHVDHGWLMTFLHHRIKDTRVLRMLKRFLKAGVVEEGQMRVSDEGTPQGGVISPLLANIYLHYVLDLWFTRRFRTSCTGAARLIRYADDFVVCFEKQADAERFRAELVERLAQFGLEVEPSKTPNVEGGGAGVWPVRGGEGAAARQDEA